MVTKLATLIGFREKIIPIDLLGHKVKVRVLVFISALSTQYYMNHLLDNDQTWYNGCH